MALVLTEDERKVLEAFADEEAKDPQGAWAAYYASIIEAVGGDLSRAIAVCRRLRNRKLLTGEGSGKHASYYLSDKGKEQIA